MKYSTLSACLVACVSICSAQEPAPTALERTAVLETTEHAVAARRLATVLQQVADQTAVLGADTARMRELMGASKEVKKARSTEERKRIDIETHKLQVDVPKQIELAKKTLLDFDRAQNQLHSVDQCLALFRRRK